MHLKYCISDGNMVYHMPLYFQLQVVSCFMGEFVRQRENGQTCRAALLQPRSTSVKSSPCGFIRPTECKDVCIFLLIPLKQIAWCIYSV